MSRAEYLKNWKAANPDKVAAHRAKERTPEALAERRYVARIKFAEAMRDPAFREKHRERTAKRRLERPEERTAIELMAAAKKRATSLELPYDLDRYSVELRARIRAGHCELSGIKFQKGVNGKTAYSASIDRIVPELGYVYSNIRVIVWALNAGFGNWGEDAFAEIAKAYLERRKA